LWLILFFFQHFEYFLPLLLTLMVSDKKQMLMMLSMWLVIPFLLLTLFSLCLLLTDWLWCLDMRLFERILVGIEHLGYIDYRFLKSDLQNILPFFPWILFSAPFFSPLAIMHMLVYLTMSHISLRLCSFFFFYSYY
jgi:hypothetical protein